VKGVRQCALLWVFSAMLGPGIFAEAVSLDSLKEQLLAPFSFLPDYYMRFDLSTFALQQNELQKRQYLAQPHPELEFCFLSYKNLIASVWKVDFLFGLGEVPGNNVFTVLDVAFGIDPTIELRLKDLTLDGGLAHRCIHEMDRSDFPIYWYNRLFLGASSTNYRLNTFWDRLRADSSGSPWNKQAWSFQGAYYLKEFFGLARPDKLNGNNPNIWDVSAGYRRSLWATRSWVCAVACKSTFGIFDPTIGYQKQGDLNWYGEQIFAFNAFFARGKNGASANIEYHLDRLPIPLVNPAFAGNNSRFSKNGMLQIGVTFFN
jgi:hypothetical protein